MVSRATFLPTSSGTTPSAEDLNAVYHLINGDFSFNKGWGASVKLTAFDALRSDGQVDLVSYALEVRNRETTLQQTVAFRRADGKIVSEVSGGLLKAVKDTLVGTSPTQVVVYGTPAGGVLGGTYPNPSFYLSEEYFRVYPQMTMLWPVTKSQTSRSDGFVGTNLEVTQCPGWVFCDGGTYKFRDGTTRTVPNMNDKLPIGASTITVGTTGGAASWTGLASLSIAHTHLIPHTHNQPNHTHTQADHTHTQADHTHSLSAHTHTQADHTHTIQHTHDLQNHTHAITDHNHTTPIHIHSLNGHTHSHNHTPNTIFHSHTHAPGSIFWSHVHTVGGLVNSSHSHGAGSFGVLINLTTAGDTAPPSGGVAGGTGASLIGHVHSVNTTKAVTGTSDPATPTISGLTGDENTAGHTFSGGVSADASATNMSGGVTSTEAPGPSPSTTNGLDGSGNSGFTQNVGAASGSNPNTTGNPVASGTSGNPSTTPNNVTSGPTSNTSGSSSTNGSSNITSVGSTSGSSNITSNPSTAGSSNVTNGTNTASSDVASTGTIDPRPPVVGMFFIMKL